MRAPIIVLVAFLSACAGLEKPDTGLTTYGYFPDPAQTQWLDDGRRMVLLRDFTFVEPSGTTWIATAAHKPPSEGDLTIDGASIPPVFWSIVGGPYEGLYRNASIVHDAECTPPHKHRWQEVHRMFYRASRAGGTSEMTAKLIFAAVWHFGPRWQFAAESFSPRTLERFGDAHRLIAYIAKNPEISLADIEGLSSDSLAVSIPPETLETFWQQIRSCNDPNGPNLGAGGEAFNQTYQRSMSTPPQPCFRY
jgi:Protein of unknown function (DUF1353)